MAGLVVKAGEKIVDVVAEKVADKIAEKIAEKAADGVHEVAGLGGLHAMLTPEMTLLGEKMDVHRQQVLFVGLFDTALASALPVPPCARGGSAPNVFRNHGVRAYGCTCVCVCVRVEENWGSIVPRASRSSFECC